MDDHGEGGARVLRRRFLGTAVIRSLWAAYLRRAEHAADRYAKKLGYSYELVEYLDVYERPLDGATPFCRGRSHPYAEQRIGRLLER